MKYMGFAAILVLASVATPVFAADVAGAGFGTGFLDGFLSLFKLLLSPFVDLNVGTESLAAGSYTFGRYLGLLSFAVAAGAAGHSDISAADVM